MTFYFLYNSGVLDGIQHFRNAQGTARYGNDMIKQQAELQHRTNWNKLGERTRTMLQRLNDCILLREHDLETLVWPQAVSRQARAERLTSWQADQFIQVIHDAQGPCYQLGRAGARLLRAARFPRIAPVRLVADRSRNGILLANRFGVSLHNDIQHEALVGGMAWTVAPWSGVHARGDGLAAIAYSLGGQHIDRQRTDAYAPMLAAENFTPAPEIAVQRFVVEIDCGTETYHQLEQRAKQWRKRWDEMRWPPATHAVFLWITTGGSTRLETIWRAWTRNALLPAFFTTVDTLTLGAGYEWHPWNPRRVLPNGQTMWVWRDMYGRARSLCPWEGDEPQLRFEQPKPVTVADLQVSIAPWSKDISN